MIEAHISPNADANPKKRKPKGTLVNPYLKKRKVQGAKFGGDDDE